ncbi:MAG TPA: hypothetical protein PLC80_01345 [Draconibacterium sp.]|nr:hypothetical protein [Draconibacterium sp.]
MGKELNMIKDKFDIIKTADEIRNFPDFYRFNLDKSMAKFYPKGEEEYFKSVIFECNKKLIQNTLGNVWIQNKGEYSTPFSIIEKSGKPWILSILDIFENYKSKEETDEMVEEAKKFLYEYFYIEMINNHLSTLNNPTTSISFSDFFTPEFTNKESFITSLKEKMHGKKSQALRFMIEALKARKILNVNKGEYKQLYEAMKDYFDWEIGSYVSIFDIPALREFKNSDDFQNYISSPGIQHKKPYQKIELIIDSILKELKI